MKQLPASLRASLRGVTLYSNDFAEIYHMLKVAGEPVKIRCDRVEFDSLDEFFDADERLLQNGFKFLGDIDFNDFSVEFKKDLIEIYSSNNNTSCIGIFEQIKLYIVDRSTSFTRIINNTHLIFFAVFIPFAIVISPMFGFRPDVPNYFPPSLALLTILFWINPFNIVRGNKLYPKKKYQNFTERHSGKIWDVLKIGIGAIAGSLLTTWLTKMK